LARFNRLSLEPQTSCTCIQEVYGVIIVPDAIEREEDGKMPSQSVLDAMAYVFCGHFAQNTRLTKNNFRKLNIMPMRLGPGKHLKVIIKMLEVTLL